MFVPRKLSIFALHVLSPYMTQGHGGGIQPASSLAYLVWLYSFGMDRIGNSVSYSVPN
jgi:hypothetical protein